MSQEKIVMDGFVRDEEGKWHIRPMPLPACAKKSSEKKPTRKYIPIERLKLPLESPENETKRRKIEKPARKELFKVPQRKSKVNTRLSFNTRQSRSLAASRTSKNNLNKKVQKSNPLVDGSPLLDIDEAEELLAKNSLPIKTATPKIIVSETINGHTPIKTDRVENNTTPKSGESESEFVEIEKALINNQSTDSPMSSVCTLLQNTKINQSGGKSAKKDDTILNEIRAIMDRDRSEYQALHQQFLTYHKKHQENYEKITGLLLQLESDGNKENKKRRSSRIAAQSEGKPKYVISPALSRKVDLRKSTLTKNLSKTLHTEVSSPRTKKAVDLYNSMRSDYTVLCTPKFDRTAIEVQQASVTRSLSRRIQKQCLLLQDTPRHAEY